jgi:hypothetical protein
MATRNSKKALAVAVATTDTVADPCIAAIDAAAASTTAISTCADILRTHVPRWASVDGRKTKKEDSLKKHASDLGMTPSQVTMVLGWTKRMYSQWTEHNAARIRERFGPDKKDAADRAIEAGGYAFVSALRLQSPEYVVANLAARAKNAKGAGRKAAKAATPKAKPGIKKAPCADVMRDKGAKGTPTVAQLCQYLAAFPAFANRTIAARKQAKLGINALENAVKLVQTALDGMHGMK